MVVAGRQKSIAFFIALGIGLISVAILLYVGWVLLNWRTGILLLLGVLLLATIISGVVINTIFLVREIRRNAQHDAFINAVIRALRGVCGLVGARCDPSSAVGAARWQARPRSLARAPS